MVQIRSCALACDSLRLTMVKFSLVNPHGSCWLLTFFKCIHKVLAIAIAMNITLLIYIWFDFIWAESRSWSCSRRLCEPTERASDEQKCCLLSRWMLTQVWHYFSMRIVESRRTRWIHCAFGCSDTHTQTHTLLEKLHVEMRKMLASHAKIPSWHSKEMPIWNIVSIILGLRLGLVHV